MRAPAILVLLLPALLPAIAPAQPYPRLAGAYTRATASPRVFDTAQDLHDIAQRTRRPGSFSAKMWARLTRQVHADLTAPVDWDATYSGCDIDIYLHAFSFESSGGYAQERRDPAQMSVALHVRPSLHPPAGAAPVAARLALYAALAHQGALLPAGAPPPADAAALSRRILLAWANHGLRDAPGRYKQKPQEFCEGNQRDLTVQSGVGLQIGRGVIYSVHAQDLLTSLRALSPADIRTLNSFHEAIWTLIRYASNFAAEPEFRHPDRLCELYSNHRAMHLLALLAIARLVDSPQWFQQALHGGLPRVPPIAISWTEYFDHAIYGERDHPIACYPNTGRDGLSSHPSFQTATVAPGEIEDRYRNANPEQGVGYPMFSLEDLYFTALVLSNAGFEPYNYRGRHGQTLQMATSYYACYAKNAGFGRTITPQNARPCPDNAQYIGKDVNEVEKNIYLGARAYPRNTAFTELVPAAEQRPDGQSLDAILFGHWPD